MTITRQTTQQLSVNAPSLILVTLLMIEAAPRGQDTFWYKKKKNSRISGNMPSYLFFFFFNHLQLWPKCTSLSQNDHILHCPRPAWHCVPERDTLLIPWLIINLLVKGHILDLKKQNQKQDFLTVPSPVPPPTSRVSMSTWSFRVSWTHRGGCSPDWRWSRPACVRLYWRPGQACCRGGAINHYQVGICSQDWGEERKKICLSIYREREL